MKRLVLVAASALLVACKSNDAGPTVTIDPAALYAQQCARCHGADGRGDPEIKKIMPVRDFSDPAFRGRDLDSIERIIAGGINQMPAFGGVLSQPKIHHLAGYVKRLATAGK